jgi:hypothetical protein
MAGASGAWVVRGHGPIEKIGSRVWRVEGDVPGMALKRVMTIARLTDGRLVVHNGIALAEDAMREIDAWGKVAFVLVPNGFHRIDAAAFAARYPDAKVLCPRGSRARVAQVVPSVGDYAELPADANVSLALIEGVGDQEGVMTITDESGVSLVLTDTVFNMPHVAGVAGFVLKHVTLSSGGPRVTRIARMFLVKDKKRLAAHLERLAATHGLTRVIVGHHEMITDAPAEALRRAAATL